MKNNWEIILPIAWLVFVIVGVIRVAAVRKKAGREWRSEDLILHDVKALSWLFISPPLLIGLFIQPVMDFWVSHKFGAISIALVVGLELVKMIIWLFRASDEGEKLPSASVEPILPSSG